MKYLVIKQENNYKIISTEQINNWNFIGAFDTYCDAYTFKLLLERGW